MGVFFIVLFGVLLGLFLGGLIALGAGLLWLEVFRPSNFEGAAAMAVGFVFVPLGAIIGAIGLGTVFGVLVSRRERRARQPR